MKSAFLHIEQTIFHLFLEWACFAWFGLLWLSFLTNETVVTEISDVMVNRWPVHSIPCVPHASLCSKVGTVYLLLHQWAHTRGNKNSDFSVDYSNYHGHWVVLAS